MLLRNWILRATGALILVSGAAAFADPVSVPVGSEWVREYTDSSYLSRAANDYAGLVPSLPTWLYVGVHLTIENLLVTHYGLGMYQFTPDYTFKMWIETADHSARYDFLSWAIGPLPNTKTITADAFGGRCWPWGCEGDPALISTFLSAGVNIYLHIAPVNRAAMTEDVSVGVGGGFPIHFDSTDKPGLTAVMVPLGNWTVRPIAP